MAPGRLASLFALAVLVAGCQSPGNDTNDGNGSGDPPKPLERLPLTLYLQLPFPCPDQSFPIPGNTTYNATMPPSGCDRTDHEALISDETLCGLFLVHDPAVQIKQGDRLYGYVVIGEVGGVNVVHRMVWRDDAGTIAQASTPVQQWSAQSERIELETTAERDSQGPIWFEVHSDGGHCTDVSAGGSQNSRFTIEPAAAVS